MTNVVAEFTIPYLQILNEHGTLVSPKPSFANDSDTLKQLYSIMLKTRMFDKKAIALQRTGKMGTYAPVNGQEAIGTAIGHAMHADDIFVPYYRDYAAQLQRGMQMSDILAYWGGDERGSNFSPTSKDLPICVPIASQCLHAAGAAFSVKYRGEDKVVVVCIGDGGTSEGDFYEAINVAGAWDLPVVFVINNNQWAISVPLSEQTATKTLAQKAIAAGMDSMQTDGNDILALRQTIGDAIDKARRQQKPTIIEALTYRLSDHTTADDATRYQPKQDVAAAQQIEPLLRFRKFLNAEINWTEADEIQLVNSIQAEIDKEVALYLERTPQPLSAMFDYHFAELPEYLIDQRAAAMEAEHD